MSPFFEYSAFSQWKKIASFPFIPGIVYFQNTEGHPETGFVGTWVLNNNGKEIFPAQLWKTTDGGKTWRNIADPGWIGAVRNIVFKDAMNGWVAIGFASGLEIACYSTWDGGETWDPILGTSGFCSTVYYSSNANLLFLNYWTIGSVSGSSLVSADQGMSWQIIPNSFNGNGFAFWDSQYGMMSKVVRGGTGFSSFLYTTDGGFTWQKSSLQESCWQPLAVAGTTMAFALDEDAALNIKNKFYRSDDYGASWTVIHQFDPNKQFSGCVMGNMQSLFAQSEEGFTSSIDNGITWFSICGPQTNGDTRFQFVNDSIIATDIIDGSLWLNTSGKGTGPRLQIANRNIIATSSSIIPVQINYANDAYNENVDSVTFILRFTGELLGFDHATSATSWQNIRCTPTDSSLICVMRYTGAGQPTLNSPVATLFFKTFVSRDTASTMTLDEVNFNQDVTFRDCMVATLSATDTIHVSLDPSCGDSLLREYLRTGKVLDIISLRPNPAQDEIELNLQSAMKQNALVEIFDALGVKVFSDIRNVIAGTSSIHLDTKSLSGGMYFLRVGEASQSFVKVK